MRNGLFVASAAVLLVVMAALIKMNQPVPSSKLLTVRQFYSYLYEDGRHVEIPVYLNDVHHPLVHEDAHAHAYLSDGDEDKRLELHLVTIRKGHRETWLGEWFTRVILVFEMPWLDADFVITDAYLNVMLADASRHRFSLGEFHLLAARPHLGPFDWTALHGMKAENSFLSRLSTIHVTLAFTDIAIEAVMIGVDREVGFARDADVLVLSIEPEAMLLTDVPLIIRYHHQGTTHHAMIGNFTYVIDHRILASSGPLIQTYALA